MFLGCGSETAFLAGLPDSSLSQSSAFTASSDASRSRLHETYEAGGGLGGWIVGETRVGEWIEADILHPVFVYKVATQGRANIDQWVTSYQLKYSMTYTSDEADFEFVTSPVDGTVVTFTANTDRSTIVENSFPAVACRFVRLYPITWHEQISMRWEVYGCANGATCPAISLVNSDVTSSNHVLPGSEVELQCLEGFDFGAAHSESVLHANCLHGAQWDVDVAEYTCSNSGKRSSKARKQNFALSRRRPCLKIS